METKNETQYRKKDVWEKHGLEKKLGSKMLNGFVHAGLYPLIIVGIFAVPVGLVLIPLSFFIDWLLPNLAFPYNLFFQLPVGAYVVWRVWKFFEEKN